MKSEWTLHLASAALVSQAIGARSKISVPLTNTINLFTIPIGVGEPSGIHHVGIDSGSRVTWCGAVTPYVTTKSTVDLEVSMRIMYEYGDAEGKYVNDTVTLKSEDGYHQIKLPKVTIGKISSPIGFDDYDGLMGLNAIWKSDRSSEIENQTLMVHMWNRGLLKQNMFAVSGKPTKSMTPEKNGVITFGGYEPSQFIGKMYWYSCKSGSHWDWTASVSYGRTALSSGPIRGIFDTGFTIGPALSSDLFTKYVASIPGAIWNQDDFKKYNPSGNVNRHLLKIPKTSISQMNDLCFKSDDEKNWCFNPEAQLIPEDLLPDSNFRYSYVSPFHASTNPNLPSFKFGMKGHERYYVVYDVGNYKRQLGRRPNFKTFNSIS
ncbi:aspartic peptidase A1 [Melampsora americana]|nr:aspartic peptidase A1 [Melampsora americana]